MLWLYKFSSLHCIFGQNFTDVVFSQVLYLSAFLYEGFPSKSLFELSYYVLSRYMNKTQNILNW